ncbi:MAG: AAC(3) family N-acetyltransferase [bacterium]|nr:AAC(3) family N-acetyltransferase [bacterium]
MSVINESDIVLSLRNLGLVEGDKLLVHSSLKAIGLVAGGPDAVIKALIEVVGPAGLIVMPTFACEPPFDRCNSATALGDVAERFWRRPDAVRSLHPTHSVAAVGYGAADLIAGHEKAPTAYAEGTPYCKLARSGGKVLLMGVDQDRNTTLHAAEAITGVPYLDDIKAAYIDDEGCEVIIPVAAMAGPHRDFIGLDRLFRERGIMRMGRIGKAICRLMEAGPMLDIAVEALSCDPAAVLCRNPACQDCIRQRGRIKAARLAEEDFHLAAVAGDIANDPAVVLETIKGEGIFALELTTVEYEAYRSLLQGEGVAIAAVRSRIGDERAVALAARLSVPLVVPVGTAEEFKMAASLAGKGINVLVENNGAPSSFYLEMYAGSYLSPGLALNPGRFAAAGEKPFLGIFYNGGLRKRVMRFYIDDALFDGTPALPGQGNGEVKEIISMLRCRGFGGTIALRSCNKGAAAFRQAAEAFWCMLENM